MPSVEYTSTGGGLKLKGAKNAGVDKKRKKSKKDKSTTAGASTSTPTERASEIPEVESKNASGPGEDMQDERESRERSATSREPETRMKTEAERRHEEMRRKRFDERIKREGGVKTHKERVEQLNKYLSGLSEHHDMPRIGPG
ncbi:hypothetical protein BDV97DRAFT_382672 [Delphinella strobiligena]|nr:hypothetical protein BDV97DRAFT_382672 [Delphinella strobiligena]